MIWKVFTILILVAAILGGTGYFVYEYYVKPDKLDAIEKEVAALPPPPPPPHPSIAAFEQLKPVLEANTMEARGAIQGFLAAYPDSELSGAARAALGRINSALVLSPGPGPEKVPYLVVSGDSLVKIAAKFKTGAELIYMANGLTTINLRIGQELIIPQLDIALVVDREKETMTVLNRGEFFKDYPIAALKLPASVSKAGVETKVSDKFMLKDSNRIAFGSKDYESGDRWIMLGTSGVAIRAMPEVPEEPVIEATPGVSPDATPGTTPVAEVKKPDIPPGIVLAPADAAELFVIVMRGTPVTIK